jgi:hypothetical protein
VELPESFEVYDLSKETVPTYPDGNWGIGKYDEVRPQIYSQEMFDDVSKAISGFTGKRDLHIGMDQLRCVCDVFQSISNLN